MQGYKTKGSGRTRDLKGERKGEEHTRTDRRGEAEGNNNNNNKSQQLGKGRGHGSGREGQGRTREEAEPQGPGTHHSSHSRHCWENLTGQMLLSASLLFCNSDHLAVLHLREYVGVLQLLDKKLPRHVATHPRSLARYVAVPCFRFHVQTVQCALAVWPAEEYKEGSFLTRRGRLGSLWPAAGGSCWLAGLWFLLLYLSVASPASAAAAPLHRQ